MNLVCEKLEAPPPHKIFLHLERVRILKVVKALDTRNPKEEAKRIGEGELDARDGTWSQDVFVGLGIRHGKLIEKEHRRRTQRIEANPKHKVGARHPGYVVCLSFAEKQATGL